MNDRFKALYKLDDNLYIKGMPIIVSAGILLNDAKTSSIITQLKFQSVTNKVIKAVKISIEAYDVSGKKLKGVDDYQYLDLEVKNGEYFGFNKAIIMPEIITRLIKIRNISVVFENESYEINGDNLHPIESAKELSTMFGETEMVKQYQISTSALANYIPKEIEDLWICSCGKLNKNRCCTNCNTSKENIFLSLNCEVLREETNKRLEKEKIEREENEKLALIKKKEQEEKAAREAEEKSIAEQKKKKNFIICTATLVFCVVFVIVVTSISSSIQQKKSITSIENFIENKQYEHAFDEVNKSKLSNDEKAQYFKTIKPKMVEQFNEEKEQYQVLDIDGMAIYERDNVIYYIDDKGDKVELYKSQEAEGKYRSTGKGYKIWVSGERVYIGYDFIYSNGYIIFTEYREEKQYEDDEVDSYKYIRAVKIENGRWETLDYVSDSTGFRKLSTGHILIDTYPDIVFNPYTGEVEEEMDLLTDSQRRDYIYDTDE